MRMESCSAPFCSVDNTGGFFELCKFPSDEDLRSKWQANIDSTSAGGSKWESDMHLCEVHFDKHCWVEDCGLRQLKDSAVPSIFQHITPAEYITVVYTRFKSANIEIDLLERGMRTIENLRTTGKLHDDGVKKELIQFSSLVVHSTLQELRINQKSELISATRRENDALKEEVSDFLSTLKEVVDTDS